MKHLLPFQEKNRFIFIIVNATLLIAFFSFGLSLTNAAITFPTVNARAKIQKQLLEDVQTSVNTQRGAVGLAQKTFTALPTGLLKKVSIKNLQEARTAIEEIYTNRSIPATDSRFPRWTDPTLIPGQTPVKAVHFTELRVRLEEVQQFLLSPQGIITTIVGTGISEPSNAGDVATIATNARIDGNTRIALDGSGNIYVTIGGTNRIRKITGSAGGIITIAGTGTAGFSGDGGQATNAQLNSPSDVVVDQNGDVFIADTYNYRIRKISATTGVITTIAGSGVAGVGAGEGDGGPAVNARLSLPSYLALDPLGNLFIIDSRRIRRITPSGIITTVVNADSAATTADGEPATRGLLLAPVSIDFDNQSNMYIGDKGTNRIRKVSAATGKITTVYTLTPGSSGTFPTIIVDRSTADIYFTDLNNTSTVRKITSSGIVSTIAGTTAGFSGDSGQVTNAKFNRPYDLAIDAFKNLYIVDRDNYRIRKVRL